jgi:4-amino-4-deoxy-L-arabinose transferase-like glycosyltransferase
VSAVRQADQHHPLRARLAGARLAGRAWAVLLDPGVILSAMLLVAVLTRLYGMDITHTSDEAYWMQRSLRFGAALVRGDLELTYRTGHPGVTVMWTGLIGIGPERLEHYLPQRFTSFTVLERDAEYLRAFAAARYAMLLVTASLLTVIVALAWRLLGQGAALLGGLLLVLDPYIVGMTRLLHVDALLGPLMALSALAGLIWWRGGSRWYLALSGLAGGLAMLTKAPAVYLPLYLGAVGLASAGRSRADLVRAGCFWLRSMLAWGVIAVAVYVLLWPVMWVNPLEAGQAVVQFVVRQGGQPHNWSNYFLGRAVTGDPGQLFYPVVLAVRLGPVAVLGLVAAMWVVVRRAATPRPAWLAVLALAGYALGFLLLMTVGGKKFDRYMLPAIIMLDVLAGLGLWLFLRRIRRAAVTGAVVLSVVLVQTSLLWSAYPYPLAFYNPLLGGAETAQRALLLGWGEGLDQVAAYLNRQPNAERLTVRIVEPVTPDYYVQYVNMAQRQLAPPGIQRLLESRQPEHIVRIHGIEYAQIYRLPPGLPLEPSELRPLPGDDEPEE